MQKNVWLRAQNSAENNFFLHDWKPIYPEVFSFPIPSWIITHEHSKNNRCLTSCEHREWGLNKKLWGLQGEKLAKRGIETTAVSQNNTAKIYSPCLESKFFLLIWDRKRRFITTSHSVVRQDAIKISEQRIGFEWSFAQGVHCCVKDCDNLSHPLPAPSQVYIIVAVLFIFSFSTLFRVHNIMYLPCIQWRPPRSGLPCWGIP